MTVDGEKTTRIEYSAQKILLGVAFFAVVLTASTIPLRMLFSPDASYHVFAYVYDEPFYAERLQPLAEGASRANPVNGFGDPRFTSQFFLEDSLRVLLGFIGLNAISFFWVWRFLFPLLILICFHLVCREAFKDTREKLPPNTLLAFAIFLTAVLFLEPILYMHTPPNFGWVNRIPTNISFIHCLLLIWLLLRALREPSPSRVVPLTLCFCALIYLRLYDAIPWSIALSLSFLWLFLKRQVGIRSAVALVFTLALALAPLIAIILSNRALPVTQELMARYFPARPWQLHASSTLYAVLAGIQLFLTLHVAPRYQTAGFSFAVATFSLPFICALFPFSSELLNFERFSVFYLPVSLTLLALAAENGLRTRISYSLRAHAVNVLSVGSLLVSVALAFFLIKVDLNTAHWNSHSPMKRDQLYVPAYTWLSNNSERSALVWLDHGFNAPLPETPNEAMSLHIGHNDLFGAVAQRRRVFQTRLFVSSISNQDLVALSRLQLLVRAEKDSDELVKGLRTYKPTYLLWRKESLEQPQAPLLRRLGKTVYSDKVGEIWKLDLSLLNTTPP